jgi:signal transduction histidine kinase
MNDTINILLVDDEPRNLDALEAILANPGYRLLRAKDADSALRYLIECDVAAIILDIQMPGTSGFELAQMIKATKRYRQIPILFLTAYHLADQDMLTGYGAGAADYLTKPLRPEIVRHKVAVFADLFRKTRALADLNEKLEERVKERTAELRRSEAALLAADRKKDEFIAILAHELRNPLAPLSFGLDLLSKHLSQNQLVAQTLTRMNRQLNHMVRLIDDLLDISRISQGTIELKKERLDLTSVIQAAVDNSRPHFERRRQRLSFRIDRPGFTFGDATRIMQIIGNLLHNAAKFTPDGGSISVELAEEGAHALIRVIDSGAGIAADQIERAFEMFARLGHMDSKGERGLGVGLALGRRLAELHGGTLTAASEGTGRGTTFTLRLPVLSTDEQSVARPIHGAQAASTAQLTIVLIEDSEDIAEGLAQWLTDQGHRVAVATAGEGGIELVAKHQPDVVLCDLGLPGMDGLEICRRVRKLTLGKQPRMVALTGWGREVDRRRTQEAGFDEHLLKPVAAETLRVLLSNIPSLLRLTAN